MTKKLRKINKKWPKKLIKNRKKLQTETKKELKNAKKWCDSKKKVKKIK